MNKIITISREFGSGGREIGKRLAEKMGFSYYDKEIIMQIAKETGMSEQYIADISEKRIYPAPFRFAKTLSGFQGMQTNQTEILVAQQKVIKEIAKKSDCIIVGRGANVILKEYNPMNIFVYADMESKIKRCKDKKSEDEELTEKELESKIIQIDKNRKEYHKIISNLEWGEKKNYHLCINTTGIEIKNIIAPLSNYITEWFGGK